MEKPCFKCGETKPLSAFYKHPKMPDGHVNKCKECNKKDVRENRAAKIEYYREYDRKRAATESGILARRIYQETESGKEAVKRAKKRYKDSNIIKRSAAVLVGNAVRDGKLLKPNECSQCGSEGMIHGHHDDYAFPLVVRWLCSRCHRKWHKENGPGANG